MKIEKACEICRVFKTTGGDRRTTQGKGTLGKGEGTQGKGKGTKGSVACWFIAMFIIGELIIGMFIGVGRAVYVDDELVGFFVAVEG